MLMPSVFGEDLFNNFFDDFAPVMRTENPRMKTDIKETDQAFELIMDLPGFKKEDLSAELKNGYLTISAQTVKEEKQDEKKDKYLRRERYYGSMSRSFYVGEELTKEDIKAKFENGVLTLVVPKKEALPEDRTAKYIAIEG